MVSVVFSVAFLKNRSAEENYHDHFPESLKKEEWIKSFDGSKEFELKTQPNHCGEHRLLTGDLGE